VILYTEFQVGIISSNINTINITVIIASIIIIIISIIIIIIVWPYMSILGASVAMYIIDFTQQWLYMLLNLTFSSTLFLNDGHICVFSGENQRLFPSFVT